MGLVYKAERKTKRIPAPQNGKGQFVHRLMMKEYLGRELLSTERVHHIDLIKQNNPEDCSNFYLYPSESEHQKGHRSLDRLVALLLQRGNIGFSDGQYFLPEEKLNEVEGV